MKFFSEVSILLLILFIYYLTLIDYCRVTPDQSARIVLSTCFLQTNLEAIMEDMLAAFENKNPSIKAESALFLARALCHTQPAAFNKKLVKAYVAGLLKLLESAGT